MVVDNRIGSAKVDFPKLGLELNPTGDEFTLLEVNDLLEINEYINIKFLEIAKRYEIDLTIEGINMKKVKEFWKDKNKKEKIKKFIDNYYKKDQGKGSWKIFLTQLDDISGGLFLDNEQIIGL